MERLSASFSPPAQSLAPGAACGTLARFADLADALEHAARAIGRLDAYSPGTRSSPLGSGVSGSRPSAGKPRPTGGRSTRGILPPSSKASGFAWVAP